MYNVNFYKDASGNEPVRGYLENLINKNDKESRIKLNKILDYNQAERMMKDFIIRSKDNE